MLFYRDNQAERQSLGHRMRWAAHARLEEIADSVSLVGDDLGNQPRAMLAQPRLGCVIADGKLDVQAESVGVLDDREALRPERLDELVGAPAVGKL